MFCAGSITCPLMCSRCHWHRLRLALRLPRWRDAGSLAGLCCVAMKNGIARRFVLLWCLLWTVPASISFLLGVLWCGDGAFAEGTAPAGGAAKAEFVAEDVRRSR